ncbi:MAG: VanZ family protein [Clostridiales bacterium]|nr:VanZ family protein [Clostridiales bacterium]
MKSKTKKRIRLISWILFVLYILLLIYLLFLAEGYGRKDFALREYQYNLRPFREIRRFWVYRERIGYIFVLLNLGGNIVGFLPFGFFLPILGYRFRNGGLVCLLGFSLSLLVECVQLVYKVGSFDVDDILLNTLGAVLGYVMFAVCNRMRRWLYEKKV